MTNDTAIIEIRPAAGGDEAKIWADDLRRMYLRFGEKQGWKTQDRKSVV
jgi:peptide chain release factor 1